MEKVMLTLVLLAVLADCLYAAVKWHRSNFKNITKGNENHEERKTL